MCIVAHTSVILFIMIAFMHTFHTYTRTQQHSSWSRTPTALINFFLFTYNFFSHHRFIVRRLLNTCIHTLLSPDILFKLNVHKLYVLYSLVDHHRRSVRDPVIFVHTYICTLLSMFVCLHISISFHSHICI